MRPPALVRLLLAVALVIGTVAGLTPTGAVATPAHRWTARPATYQVVTEKDQRIRMSDGTILVADVLRPGRGGKAVGGRFPVLLTQTPYNKNLRTENHAVPYLVERGYVQVIADVRGTGGSQGDWLALGKREQRDGYELVAWAASKKRPWSNGRVGTYGISYAGINQLLTAAQHPPALKALFPIVPSGDPYRDLLMTGGQPNVGFTVGWFGLVTGAGVAPPSYTAQDPAMAASVMAQHAARATELQGPLLAEGLTGGDVIYDSPFWRAKAPLTVIDKVRVPTFIFGGWYDVFQRSQPMLYQRLRQNGVPARLVMGPWNHLKAAAGGTLPEQGVPSRNDLVLRWMDRYLRGRPDSALARDIAPITYHDLGTGKWRTARSWLAPEVAARALRLDGPASHGTPGRLTTGTARAEADTLYPVPIAGLCSRSTSQWTAGVVPTNPCDENQALDNPTGLSYDLPVRTPLRLLGPIGARLFISTTATEGMIGARVEDVAPDGTVKQLTGGWQVLSLRALDRRRTVVRDGRVLQPYHPLTRDSVLPVKPGKVMEVHVEIFPTGATIQPGHTLRLTLQAADLAHLTAPVSRQPATATGVLSIHHDRAHPSQLILPTMR